MTYFIGVDVGTGSARAGVFDPQGTLHGSAEAPIETYRPRPTFAQQGSADVWSAVCACVRSALSGLDAGAVAGIGFDATCSLVVTGAEGTAISVCPDGAPDHDIILWMDHRAIADAEEINALGGAPLRYVGGVISPEMELPKLRWLKREMPQSWAKAKRFWDLPDWLVHKASGSEVRSLCSTVCKWSYLGHEGQSGEGWDDGFLARIGLEDLSRDGHAAIGAALAAPGTPLGHLTPDAAQAMGLHTGVAVAASMIDAHAGALGTLGVTLDGGDLTQRLAMIAGTSTCHIGLSQDAVFVPGIWGPYYGAVLDGYWALEGGQSAAGALIDAVIARHSGAADLPQDGKRLTDHLEARLADMAGEVSTLTAHRHVQPDFHGNRSPLAEPWRRGGLDGLVLESGPDDLALDYLAAVQALAYGTRQILERMAAQGARFDTLVLSGGLAKSPRYQREHADATGCTILVPDQPEPVLLGSAMLGAMAAGTFASLPEAMAAMSGGGTTIEPRRGEIAAFHDRKFQVFERMQADHAAYRSIMSQEWDAS